MTGLPGTKASTRVLRRFPQVDALEDRAGLRGAGTEQREGGAQDFVLGERIHRMDDGGEHGRAGANAAANSIAGTSFRTRGMTIMVVPRGLLQGSGQWLSAPWDGFPHRRPRHPHPDHATRFGQLALLRCDQRVAAQGYGGDAGGRRLSARESGIIAARRPRARRP